MRKDDAGYNETSLEGALVEQSAQEGKDKRTRHIMTALIILLVASIAVTAWAVWEWLALKTEQAEAGANVASTVIAACADANAKKQLADLGISCGEAEKVVEEVKAGPQGVPGIPGIQGPRGEQGERGPQGPKGDKGDTGDTGATGETGEQGETGLTGAQGSEGLQGPMGPQGSPGPQGAQGEPGPAGPPGPQGEPGADGEDAFPFVFLLTVPGSNPAQPDRTYRYTCSAPGEQCTSEEVTSEP